MCKACNVTKLMHCLPSLRVTTPLNVSGLLVAHHQEAAMYICDSWYVLYGLVDCQLAWFHSNQASWQSTETYNTYQLSHIYIAASWWWATSKPETCRGVSGGIIPAVWFNTGINGQWHWQLASYRSLSSHELSDCLQTDRQHGDTESYTFVIHIADLGLKTFKYFCLF
jgi:hypothetical protein